jgi:hypothetical protein
MCTGGWTPSRPTDDSTDRIDAGRALPDNAIR